MLTTVKYEYSPPEERILIVFDVIDLLIVPVSHTEGKDEISQVSIRGKSYTTRPGLVELLDTVHQFTNVDIGLCANMPGPDLKKISTLLPVECTLIDAKYSREVSNSSDVMDIGSYLGSLSNHKRYTEDKTMVVSMNSRRIVGIHRLHVVKVVAERVDLLEMLPTIGRAITKIMRVYDGMGSLSEALDAMSAHTRRTQERVSYKSDADDINKEIADLL